MSLQTYTIKGYDISITKFEKLLVAASGVIPVFEFEYWEYEKLQTIYLFKNSFDIRFKSVGNNKGMNGLVGGGFMTGKMYLSKKALYQGFVNEKDGKNTGIHEFLHLIDMEDGNTDGVPALLLNRQYLIPWIDMMKKVITQIEQGESILSDYAGTNRVEFFAEVSAYFLENPENIKQENPELYKLLSKIFRKKINAK